MPKVYIRFVKVCKYILVSALVEHSTADFIKFPMTFKMFITP